MSVTIITTTSITIIIIVLVHFIILYLVHLIMLLEKIYDTSEDSSEETLQTV